MRYADCLASASRQLAAAGTEQPSLDARLLLQHAAGITHAEIISRLPHGVTGQVMASYEALIGRRLAGEPVHRIIGKREFFGLELAVTPAVLDPRPETEILVARVLEDHRDRERELVFADVGTGSGAIAVALLANLPRSRCLAIDISPEALAVARANACAHGVDGRMQGVRADYLEGTAGPFDFIVSNPPYIRSADIPGLSAEVRDHDPRLALDGGAEGLNAYHALFDGAAPVVKPNGRLYVEIGADQACDVCALAAASKWRVVDLVSDLSGKDRVVVVERHGR